MKRVMGAVAPRSLFSPFLFKELYKVLVAMLRYEAVVGGIEQSSNLHNLRELCEAYLGIFCTRAPRYATM
jgi:hypothetical protein